MFEVVFSLVFARISAPGFCPGEGVRALVPAGNELPDLAHQVRDRGERAAVDGLALDDSKPDLDYVPPRSGRGGEVDVDAQVNEMMDPGWSRQRIAPSIATRCLINRTASDRHPPLSQSRSRGCPAGSGSMPMNRTAPKRPTYVVVHQDL